MENKIIIDMKKSFERKIILDALDIYMKYGGVKSPGFFDSKKKKYIIIALDLQFIVLN